jgi:predicted PurR-regulated permease PerM
MMEIVEQARTQLPAKIGAYLPADSEDARLALGEWVHEHGQELQVMGRHAAAGFVHVLIGMVLGALVALGEVHPVPRTAPLAHELERRCALVADAFRRIVFAQIRISGLNTLFTALFLLCILPLFGVQLPLAKTLIVVTFVVGLLPILGNLVSNTVITVIALSVSIYVAIAALAFLIVVHKLEYFLNARIVGGQIQSRAWELLTAMLILEAAFGLSGLIAAPIYYAYVKRELTEQGWV